MKFTVLMFSVIGSYKVHIKTLDSRGSCYEVHVMRFTIRLTIVSHYYEIHYYEVQEIHDYAP